MNGVFGGVRGSWRTEPAYTALVSALLVAIVLLPFLGVSPYLLNFVGQMMCFALLALSLDLIWGYMGYLSLGHGLFFALGGYLFGMHLIKVTYAGGSSVPVFLRYMGLEHFPWYWFGLESLGYTVALIVLATLLVSFFIGFLAFRSQVTGVYFAIITQAIVYVLMLILSNNETGLGGTNGIGGFTTLLGSPLNSNMVVVSLAEISTLLLLVTLVLLHKLTKSGAGYLLTGIRDDEDRLRTLGYETLWLKIVIWCFSALIAAFAGMLYVPQIGVASPQVLTPMFSLEIAVWVAIGGRGRLYGAVIGAMVMTLLQFVLTRYLPSLWPFVLAFLVLFVVVILDNGFIGPGDWKRNLVRWTRNSGGFENKEVV